MPVPPVAIDGKLIVTNRKGRAVFELIRGHRHYATPELRALIDRARRYSKPSLRALLTAPHE